jgi:hypothetical protein
MDWKTANREIVLHNLNCEDGSYIEVNGVKQNGGMTRIVPNRFFTDGSVVDVFGVYFESWELIEPPTDDDILKQAKEICFKTGYVRRKNWNNIKFVSVVAHGGDNFYMFGMLSDMVKAFNANEIVKFFESVDPRA